jgi:putative transposase
VDVCWKHRISTVTFYVWKAKFGGQDVSEAKRLKALEDENAKLKRLLADALLDRVALKDLLTKSSDARRQAGGSRLAHHDLRDERAADGPGHQGGPHDGPLSFPTDDGLRLRLRELAGEQRRFGDWRRHVPRRHEGHALNRKKT